MDVAEVEAGSGGWTIAGPLPSWSQMNFVLPFQAGGLALAEEELEPCCFCLWETEAESHTSSLPRQAPLLRSSHLSCVPEQQ